MWGVVEEDTSDHEQVGVVDWWTVYNNDGDGAFGLAVGLGQKV